MMISKNLKTQARTVPLAANITTITNNYQPPNNTYRERKREKKKERTIIPSPTAIDHRVQRGESGHSGSSQGRRLHLLQTLRVPLHRAVGIEQRHRNGCVRDGVVLRAVSHADPYLCAVVLGEVGILASTRVPDTEQTRQINKRMIINPFCELQPLDILLDALSHQNCTGG
jgi:hypothetical protein